MWLAEGSMALLAGCSHILFRLLKDQDPQRSQRVMQAMMQMKKIDIPALESAYNQQS